MPWRGQTRGWTPLSRSLSLSPPPSRSLSLNRYLSVSSAFLLQALAAIDGGAKMQLKLLDGGMNLQAKKLGIPTLAARQVALHPETRHPP